jgi:membrane fusion protein (multidrug efflux system)/multidrug efflux system membrane fusion protein
MRAGRLAAAVLLPAVLAAAPAPHAGEEPGFLGVLLARDSLDLAPAFEGKLVEVRVRLGDPVRRGQTLFVLDDQWIRQELVKLRADRNEARAGVREAATRLRVAEEEHERLARFPEISAERQIQEARKEVDLARTGLQMAEARLQQEEASVEQLESRLDQLEVVAPFDGTVAVRYHEPGAMTGPDTPVLRLIGDEGHWVRFAVPLDRLAELAVDRPVRVRVPSLGVALSGEIRQIAAEVDSASGMVFCEAMLEPGSEAGGTALHGRKARVDLDGD